MKEILITSSILILVLAGLRLLLKGRIKACLQYALWLLVAVRLLVPMQFGSLQFSAANLANRGEPAAQLTQRQLVGPSYEEAKRQITVEHQQLANPPVLTEAVLEQEIQSRMTGPTIGEFLLGVWIFGAVAMGAWFFAANLLFWKRARKNARLVFMQGCPVPVYVTKDVPSPCLVGFARPKIYLTPACLENERQLCHVLRHELTHLQHKDNCWSLVRCVCLCLYWFHPLVWAAAALSRRDCELACDESALAKLGEEERLAYGRTLLHLVTQQQASGLVQVATTMTESKRQLKERITRIAKRPKQAAAAVIVTVLVAAIAVGCTFSGGVKEENPTLPDPSAPTQIVEQTTYGGDILSLTSAESDQDAAGASSLLQITQPVAWLSQERPGAMTVHVYAQDCQENDTMFYVELYDAPTMRYADNVSQPLARVRRILEPGTQNLDITIGFHAKTLNLHSYICRMYLCRQDDTILDSAETIVTVEPDWEIGERITYFHTVLSTDGYPIESISRNVGEYIPCSVDPIMEEVQFSDPGVVEVVENTQGQLHQSIKLRAIGVGKTVVTFHSKEENVSTSILVYVGDGKPALTNPRYPGTRALDRYKAKPFQLLDASGEDIAPIAVDLWYASKEIYNESDYTMFQESSTTDPDDNRFELCNYEQVVDSVFTANARRQLEETQTETGRMLIQQENGKYYRTFRGLWLDDTQYVVFYDMQVKRAEENYVVLSVECGSSHKFSAEHTFLDFALKKVDGVWMVDDFSYPTAFYDFY